MGHEFAFKLVLYLISAQTLSVFSGLLTGKFKRTSKPEETKSRLGHVLSTKSTATQAAPSWNDYVVDEKYWDLMSSLERIANNHGNKNNIRIYAQTNAQCMGDPKQFL